MRCLLLILTLLLVAAPSWAEQVLTPGGYVDASTLVAGNDLSAFDEFGQPQVNHVVSVSHIAAEDQADFAVGYQINGGAVFNAGQSMWALPAAGRAAWRVVHAPELVVGDTLATDTNASMVITTIDPVVVTDWYRFEVDGDHSFIEDGFQVHNASRWYVGGNGNTWHVASGNTTWASSSGGAVNASEPGTGDTAFFDNAGAVNMTGMNGAQSIAGIDFVNGGGGAYVNTFTHDAGITIGLASTTTVLTLNSSMTYTATSGWTKAVVNNGTLNVTSGGKTFVTFTLTGATTGATIAFQDNFTGGNGCSFSVRGTTLQPNGHTVQVATLAQSVSGAVYDFGSNAASKFIVTGAGSVFNAAGTWSNLVAGNEVKLTSVSATAKTAAFGTSFNQPNLNFTVTGDNVTVTATTALTLGVLDNSSIVTNGLILPQGITTTLSNFISTSGGAKLSSSSAGNAATISVASGRVDVFNMSIKDSTATGGATFIDLNGTSVSGNTGWSFGTKTLALLGAGR